MEKARVEAFSDGVFAVAITLLVLDLNVAGPGSGHHSLLRQLGHLWPDAAAYIVSFMVIGIMWVNHHTLFGKVKQTDRTLLFLNLLLLLFVAVLPFPTRLVARYLASGGWDAKVALALYSTVMWCTGLGYTAIYLWCGHRDELLDDHVDVGAHRSAARQFGVGSIAYVLIIGLSFLSPALALLAHFAVAVFYVGDRTAARA